MEDALVPLYPDLGKLSKGSTPLASDRLNLGSPSRSPISAMPELRIVTGTPDCRRIGVKVTCTELRALRCCGIPDHERVDVKATYTGTPCAALLWNVGS